MVCAQTGVQLPGPHPARSHTERPSACVQVARWMKSDPSSHSRPCRKWQPRHCRWLCHRPSLCSEGGQGLSCDKRGMLLGSATGRSSRNARKRARIQRDSSEQQVKNSNAANKRREKKSVCLSECMSQCRRERESKRRGVPLSACRLASPRLKAINTCCLRLVTADPCSCRSFPAQIANHLDFKRAGSAWRRGQKSKEGGMVRLPTFACLGRLVQSFVVF